MLEQVSWKIGGQQGEGIESAGELLAGGLNRQGYHLYGYRVFSSRIRGGHSNYNLRASTKPVASIADSVDLLFALDQESVTLCAGELHSGGLLIADEKNSPVLPSGASVELFPAPLAELALQAGNVKMKNVVAVGMTAAIFGLPAKACDEALQEEFAAKSETVLLENREAFMNGWDFARKHPELFGRYGLEPGDGRRRSYLIGNEAINQGAIDAGARFMAAYPITPASEIMEFMVRRLPELGGRMVQTEDEIAACMMAIGANYAGVRAFTATSGPGLSLMAESIGLAGMTETPLVVVDVQRGGPSTGLPTKHEQSDILAAIFSTHGEAPKIVMAPDSAAAAYGDTMEAFNLAEEYQCPVILLSDMQISLGSQTMEPLAAEVPMQRGQLKKAGDLPDLPKNQYFKRYLVTPDGISPRVAPGTRNGIHHATGLEHDETGRPFEGTANRIAQTDKRLRKLTGVAARFAEPVRLDAPYEQADMLVIACGAANGPLAEAVAQLRQTGLKVNHAALRLLHPFPLAAMSQAVAAARQIVVIEHNATAQLTALVRMRLQTDKRLHSVLKYDGDPFRPAEIVVGCQEVL